VFVTLEGPEGAGKSSVIRVLGQRLEGLGHDVVVTREPGGSWFGPTVRQLLLEDKRIDAKAELLLFLADRAQHVAETIRPAIESSKIVLCDRFVDSTIAYQGYGRGLDIDRLREWNDFATGALYPDLTLLFDLEPSIGLARIQHKDRLDAEPLSFHEAVRDGFLKEAAKTPARWAVLDAAESLEKVTEAAFAAVIERQTER
jgi:dTMP kinase